MRWILVAGLAAAMIGVVGTASSGAVWGQEAAFMANKPVARYEEAPGSFHILYPCAIPTGGASNSGPQGGAGLIAVCWPMLLGKIDIVEGKPKFSTPVSGQMMVSATLVRFVPDDAKIVTPMQDQKPSELEAKYQATGNFELLRTPGGFFGLGLRPFCMGCKPNQPASDGKHADQVKEEYGQFEQSLKNFDAVAKKINEVMSQVRIEVAPKNQPGLDDVADAMGLFADLNQRLAGLCTEPARSCVQQYAAYQKCKSGDLKAECGVAPSCSAVCTVKGTDYQALKSTFCLSRGGDSLALEPDWTPALVKLDEKRKAAAGSAGPVAMNANSDGKKLDFLGKPVDEGNPCSVESSYAMAAMSHMGGAIRVPKIAGTGAPAGTQDMGFVTAGPVGPGPVRISAGVAAGLILSRVPPVYPPVAKAARISGTVVLHARISKTGDIEDLSVISGPDMLQASAAEAVKQWKYKPFVLNGTPVAVDTQINVNYSFGEAPGAAGTGPAPAQPQ